MKLLWMIGFMVSASAFAAQAPKVPDFTFELKEDQLTLTPPDGHHFNTEAPIKISAGKVTLKPESSEDRIKTRLSRAALKASEVTASAYICDNAKTYCMKKTEKFSLKKATRAVSSANENGFIMNDPAKAFALAKEKNLPLLIDVFGIWCPPCNSLDATVFHSASFIQDAPKKFILLKIDSDREENQKFTKQYAVKGLPTVLFTKADGDEIFRVTGSRDLTEFTRLMNDAFQNREDGYSSLRAKAKKGDASAANRAAQIALDTDRPEEAFEILKGQPQSELTYKVSLANTEKSTDSRGQIHVIREWLKNYPNTVQAVDLYSKLVDLEDSLGDNEAKKTALQEGVAVVEKYLRSPPPKFRQETDYTTGDLQEVLADFYDQLGDKTKAASAYQACADAFTEQARAEKSDFPRGPNLERTYCLYKMGKVDEAEAIAREGIRRYPDEFTFHARLARILFEAKKDLKGAMPEARTAFKTAYGRQHLRIVLLESDIAKGLNDRSSLEQALKDVNDVLKWDHSEKSEAELRVKKTELEQKLSSTAPSKNG